MIVAELVPHWTSKGDHLWNSLRAGRLEPGRSIVGYEDILSGRDQRAGASISPRITGQIDHDPWGSALVQNPRFMGEVAPLRCVELDCIRTASNQTPM